MSVVSQTRNEKREGCTRKAVPFTPDCATLIKFNLQLAEGAFFLIVPISGPTTPINGAIEHEGLRERCRKELILRVARRRSLYSFSNTANSLFVEQKKVSIPGCTAREPRPVLSERA